MTNHRDTLIENLSQVAACRRDVLAVADALRSQVLRQGPLRLDGNDNEQLEQQLRGLTHLLGEVDRPTAEAIRVLDQIGRLRGQLEVAGQALPPFPVGLGLSVPPESPAGSSPAPLESDLVRQVKSERDAALARLAMLESPKTDHRSPPT